MEVDLKRKGRGFKKDKQTNVHGEYETLKSSEGLGQKSVEGWIILVTGVHEEATEDDLYEKYAEFGPIKDLHLNLDRRTGYVKGYCLLEYEDYAQAKNAIDATNGSELLGLNIKADFAFSKRR
ncbi:RNA binding motif protein 8B [Gorgonomyces haynaldii]|nr:RNA binding motif protein 8B [Gorgonomyces haynaldii]